MFHVELRTPRPPGPGQADAPPLDDDADRPGRQVRLRPGTPLKPPPRMPAPGAHCSTWNSARRGHRDRGKPTPHPWTTMEDNCDSYQERRGSRYLDAWPPGVPCFTELRTPRPPGPGQADAPPLDDDADQPGRQLRLLPGTPWKPLPRMPGHQERLVSRNSARRGHRDRGKPTPHRWTTMRTSLEDNCDSYQERRGSRHLECLATQERLVPRNSARRGHRDRGKPTPHRWTTMRTSLEDNCDSCQERRGSRHLECLATRSALFHGTPHAAATGTGASRRPTAGRRKSANSDRKRRWKPPPRMPGHPGAPCSTWNIRTPRHRDPGTPTPTAGRRGGAGCKSVGRVATHPARRRLRLRWAPTNPPGVGAVLRPGLLAIP